MSTVVNYALLPHYRFRSVFFLWAPLLLGLIIPHTASAQGGDTPAAAKTYEDEAYPLDKSFDTPQKKNDIYAILRNGKFEAGQQQFFEDYYKNLPWRVGPVARIGRNCRVIERR